MVGTDNEGWDFWTAFGAPGFGKITGAHLVHGGESSLRTCMTEGRQVPSMGARQTHKRRARTEFTAMLFAENGREGAGQRCGGGEKGRDGEIESYARVCSGLRILKKYVI